MTEPITLDLDPGRPRRPARGDVIIVVDDEDRENEGDFVVAAEHGDAGDHQLPRQARPRPGLPRRHARAAARARPPADGRREHRAARHVVHRVGRRGRRAHHRHLGARPRADRAGVHRPAPRGRATSRAPATSSRSQAQPGGVLQRAGHTEAVVDLCRLAGLVPGRACSARSWTRTAAMARLPRLREMADRVRPRSSCRSPT